MPFKSNQFPLVLYIVVCFSVLQSNSLNVNPKVDFMDEESSTGENQQEKMAPKIQSVSVSVDTKNVNNKIGDSAEGKTEIIKIKTNGDGKQTVGIRTDITLEIADTKNDSKPNTDGRLAENDTNEEVPIYRGTDSSNTGASNQRNSFHRRYDPINVYYNQPIFQRTNDETVNYDRSGTWINFVPVTWTTERNYIPQSIQRNRESTNNFVPYSVGHKGYKPCLCTNDDSSWTAVNIPVPVLRRSFRPTTTSRPNKVDDKLEDPFSEAN